MASLFPDRPSTAPDFLLSRSTGSVLTQGSVETFTDPSAAVDALKSSRVEMVVGALPFLPAGAGGAAAALTVPEVIRREATKLHPHQHYRGPAPSAHAVDTTPSADQHATLVAQAVEVLRSDAALDKVVLARAVDYRFDSPTDPLLIAARLIDGSLHGNGFIADLSPAGGGMLVGCSPEVLVRRHGRVVSAYPLAGSLPRSEDSQEDLRRRDALLSSAKDLAEHAFVVESLRQSLAPYCELSIPEKPEVTATREMWHLATPITGRLRDGSTTALELAMAVHPTPAICGTPTSDAYEQIAHLEPFDRGFYAGAVGWCDSQGDGEYMVAIRCAEVAPDCLSARAWAGGGIVAASSPDAEVAEAEAKLRTIGRALGV